MNSTKGLFIIENGIEKYKDLNEIQIDDPDDRKRAGIEMWIAKKIGERLVEVYNNRQWGVKVDTLGGIVVISCPSLSKTKGYVLHISKGSTVQELQQRSIRAAGEILERYGVSRARRIDDGIVDALPRSLATDEVISADAAPEPISKRVA